MSSFLSKVELKNQLKKMGINIEGNYVRKGEIKSYLSKVNANLFENEVDAAVPTEEIKNSIFYHGTPTKERADKIWKQGLKANLSDIPKHWIAHPMPDHVYVSRYLGEALIYALGQEQGAKSWLSGRKLSSRYIEKYGQFGYILVIKGNQLQDIHPDEDQISETLQLVLLWPDRFKKFAWLLKLAKKHLSPDLLEKTKNKVLDMEGGKILLPHLTDEQKIQIIHYWGNVAHKGKVVPSEMWEIDRKKAQLLKIKKDEKSWTEGGGIEIVNFEEIARKIKSR